MLSLERGKFGIGKGWIQIVCEECDNLLGLADVVDCLVVKDERAVNVVHWVVSCQHGVIGLDDGGADLWWRVDWNFQLAFLPELIVELFHQQSGETWSSATAKRVKYKKSLKRIWLFGNLADGVENSGKDFSANGQETACKVIGGVFLGVYHLIRMEQVFVGSVSHFVDDSRLGVLEMIFSLRIFSWSLNIFFFLPQESRAVQTFPSMIQQKTCENSLRRRQPSCRWPFRSCWFHVRGNKAPMLYSPSALLPVRCESKLSRDDWNPFWIEKGKVERTQKNLESESLKLKNLKGNFRNNFRTRLVTMRFGSKLKDFKMWSKSKVIEMKIEKISWWSVEVQNKFKQFKAFCGSLNFDWWTRKC